MIRHRLSIALAAAAVMVAAGIGFAAPKAGEQLTVRVLRAKVMKKPKFIGASAGRVSRGDTLTFRGAKGAWYQVDGKASGWIHKTSVVKGKVKLSSTPGGGTGGASRDEVELAGRGFTPQVEDKYRKDNPTLDFAHVDAIESTEIDSASVEEFATAGGLGSAGASSVAAREGARR